MNIDIGDGRFGQITVHEEDEPEDLAEEFCQRYNLDTQLRQALVTQIEQHIDSLVQEQQVPLPEEQESAPRKKEKQFSHQPQINENSRHLARGRDQMSVYDRLHNLAKKPKQDEPVQAEPKAPSPRPVSPSKQYPFSNPGHKLYYKGLKMKQDVELHCVQMKQHQTEKMEQQLTFKPDIKLSSAKVVPGRVGKPEEMLLLKGMQAKEKMEKLRKEKEEEEKKQCKFVPKVNSKSAQSSRSRSQENVFRGLYEDAQRLKERHDRTSQALQRQQCPFRPQVHPSRTFTASFLQRQQDFLKNNEQSLELERSKLYDNVDPVTGQEFFKPRTGRSPRRVKREPALALADTAKEENESKHKSEQLLLKRKIERFQEIFSQLRPDEQGYISVHRIVVEEIDKPTLRVIAPVLEELESFDQTLNFPEFVDAMEELLKTLTPGEKADFLDYRKKTETGEAPTFAPAIRPYKFSPGYEVRAQMPIYQRLLTYQQAVDTKVQAEKERKLRKELAGCSFKPSLEP